MVGSGVRADSSRWGMGRTQCSRAVTQGRKLSSIARLQSRVTSVCVRAILCKLVRAL